MKCEIKVIKYTHFVIHLGQVANILEVLFAICLHYCISGKNNFPYDYLLLLHRPGAKLLMVTSIICQAQSRIFLPAHWMVLVEIEVKGFYINCLLVSTLF